ncbi:uncharacterized protein C8A04DRAFT_35481 [Dichotomopilus funicola]|uniref:non-specific serine/threonine protein kinase n=1 Tax=Dichotomopilus funicola TaxID=1934379 RepID=A0AAN6V6S5_9PEZI|nr:hypothetical protein C8A04DRAFT_35481 [Dichotomopilus funicola]
MEDQAQSELIGQNPIGNGPEAFRNSYALVCNDRCLPFTPESFDQIHDQDLNTLIYSFLWAAQKLPTADLLPSTTGRGTLQIDLFRLELSLIEADGFDFDGLKPLLKDALAEELDDALVWRRIYDAHELGPIHVDIPRFRQSFFGGVTGLEAASKAVFSKCMEGSNPLFTEGWVGWPSDADPGNVLSWFAALSERLARLGAAANRNSSAMYRRPLARPNKQIQGSTAERKLDVGFVDNPKAGGDSKCHWSRILIPGEIKSNPSRRYVKEVLAAQDGRRFIVGFTLRGSLMRIWEFDRLGGIASESFDINKDGLQFVSTVLGLLWMDDEQLGFDPTIPTISDGQRALTIQRNGQAERLILDKLMKRVRCIAGRGTTCWMGHREGEPKTRFVIKDAWQDVERDEEGKLLKEAADKGVVNVVRYYHRETVFARGEIDDIQHNVRRGLDVLEPTKDPLASSEVLLEVSVPGASREGPTNTIGLKRLFTQTNTTALPPNKRSCLASPTKANSSMRSNRTHTRIILRDCGKPIYKASSPSALLAALQGCIGGHESLHKAGILHRDISINNLLINEHVDENPSWDAFLIDLDLAVREDPDGTPETKRKAGTRAFMAIGALRGEQHSFMHDLESFFWILFWICIHYNGPGNAKVVAEFDRWNYMDTGELTMLKEGILSDGVFEETAERFVTEYDWPLFPCVNELRRTVFPGGGRWKRKDEGLYMRMRNVLEKARTALAES